MNKKIKIGGFEVKNDNKLFFIAGPCVIENRDHALYHAKMIKEICDELSLDFVFKSSFDKANRTNINSSRGVGIEKGLEILNEINTSNLVDRKGIIYIWTNKNLKSRKLEIKIRDELGVKQKLLTKNQILDLEPNLNPVFDQVVLTEILPFSLTIMASTLPIDFDFFISN